MNEEIKKEEEIKKKDKGKIPMLRTFKIDASEYIRKENISMVDVAVAQSNKKFPSGLEREEYQKRTLLKKITIIFSILAVILSTTAFTLFITRDKKPSTPTVINFSKSIVVTEKEKEIDINNLKEDIKNVLYDDNLLAGEMLNVFIFRDIDGIREIVNIKDFFETLGIKTPIGLLDVLEDKFMYAIFNGFQNNPLLILKLEPTLKSYENTFAAMLRWEKTIGKDFEEYFGYKGSDYYKNSFYDIEINNIDTRTLKNSEGVSVIIYSFINRKYLVITTDENTLKEVLRRLSSTRYLND